MSSVSRRIAVDAAGYVAAATRIASPNRDARPAGTPPTLVVVHGISLPPRAFGGDGVVRLFTNTLDVAAHPFYATVAQLRVSAHFFIRRDGALLQFVSCRRPRVARGRLVVARARAMQRLLDRDRARGHRRRAVHGAPVREARRCCCARSSVAIRSRPPSGTATSLRAARPIPAPRSTGIGSPACPARACSRSAGSMGWPGGARRLTGPPHRRRCCAEVDPKEAPGRSPAGRAAPGRTHRTRLHPGTHTSPAKTRAARLPEPPRPASKHRHAAAQKSRYNKRLTAVGTARRQWRRAARRRCGDACRGTAGAR